MTAALSLRAVADRLGVSSRQVRRWVADIHDPLPTLKLGPRCRRVSIADLDAWIARRRETRPAPAPGLFVAFSDDARRALEALFQPEAHPKCTLLAKSAGSATSDPLIVTQVTKKRGVRDADRQHIAGGSGADASRSCHSVKPIDVERI